MKTLLYSIAIVVVFFFVANWSVIAAVALGLVLVGVLLWTKRATIATFFASQAYFVKGDREKAESRYKYAYDTGLMTYGGKVSYAAFCLYTEKYDRCRRLLSSVINSSAASATDRINAQHYFSILLWKEGDLDAAIEQLEGVHKDAPSTGTYGSLGAFYIEKSKRDGCYRAYLDFMKEAYDYNDTDKTISDNLGELYLLLGEHINAEEVYIKLFKTPQISPVPHYHYAKVLKHLGKKEEARDYLEKALACNFARSLTVSRTMVKEELESLN